MSLKQRALYSFSWMTASMLLNSVLGAAQLIVMARMLSPSDVAALGLLTLTLSFGLMVFDFGVSQAAIHRTDMSAAKTEGLRRVVLVMAIVGAGAILLVRDPLSEILRSPPLKDLALTAAIILLFFLPSQFRRSLFERDLLFRPVAIAESAGLFIGTFASLALLFAGFGVWAVALGVLLNYLVQAALIRSPLMEAAPPPSFEALPWALRFGLPHTTQRTLNFFVGNLDFLLVGVLIGPWALGQYMVAYNMCNILAARFNPIIGRVLFPILTRLRDDRKQTNRALCLLLNAVATFAGPPLLGLGALAPTLVPLMLGKAWAEAGSLLQLLVFVGYLRAIGGVSGPAILGFGRPAVGLRWSIVAIILQGAGIYAGVKLGGTMGVAWSFVLLQFLFLPLSWWLIYWPLSALPFSDFCRAVLPGLVSSLAVMVGAAVTLHILAPGSVVLAIGCAIIAGILIFALISLAFRRSYSRDVIELMRGSAFA